MKRLFTLIFLTAMTLQMAAATWTSKATGTALNCTVRNAKTPAKDAGGKYMTVVYLKNLSCEKIGQNPVEDDVNWLLNEGYRVIEVDYAHHEKAVSPYINLDIIEINSALNGGSFAGASSISNSRAYILFEGYRLMRDVEYFVDDPKVYNWPGDYTKGDKIFMDIAYPANPSHEVPTMLSFSYSNSYHGKEHQRMFLGYTLSIFHDSILEGLPAVGMAWAIADHPKYCDWGQGKPAGGANKDLGAVEVNPDAARKVKSAIRTLRHHAHELGLGSEVGVFGFSRGSTAASLAIGNAPFAEWLEGGYYPEEASDVQVAVLGPGVFDYSLMASGTNEYKRMKLYCESRGGNWAQQGGALAIGTSACPCFLFYNSKDDANYDTQMRNLISLLETRNVEYTLLKDFKYNTGNAHAIPETTGDIEQLYAFLKSHLQKATDGIAIIPTPSTGSNTMAAMFSITGQRIAQKPISGIFIQGGKKRVIR